jgi:hypothetical protein
MSILNLGLQSIGFMQNKMNDESKNLMNKCGTMNEICKIAEENSTLKEDLIASLQAPIDLISGVFNHQSLKDKPFETYKAASEIKIKRFWETIQLVDESVIREDRTADHIKQRASKLLVNINGKKIYLHTFVYRHIYKNSWSTVVRQDITFFQLRNAVN